MSRRKRLTGALLFLLIFLAYARTPPALQQREWRNRIKRTLFVPDPLPHLNPDLHGQFEPVPDVIAQRVTYATEFGMRIPAILYLPKPLPRQTIPALIVVNGHGGDKYSWYAFYSGILYAKAGAAVLTYDPIGEGERNADRKSGTRAHDRRQGSDVARRLAGLMMTDVMQAVSFLAGRSFIDANRIGAMGYSMGSFVLSLACAVELRLHACVLAGGGDLDGPGEYWDSSKPMCQGIPYQSLSFLGDRPAVLFALHASRGPTLIYNGSTDTVVAIPTHGEAFFENLRVRTLKVSGASNDVFEFGFEPGASHRPFFVTRPVAAWLHKQLRFPKWNEIESAPETHIGEWAQAKHVEMDPGYSSEDREGGTRAMGADVPGLSRDELSVFSTKEWETQKHGLTYESWLEHTKSGIK